MMTPAEEIGLAIRVELEFIFGKVFANLAEHETRLGEAALKALERRAKQESALQEQKP